MTGKRLKRTAKFIYELLFEFIEDDCMSLSGAIAYYTIFAMAPLMVITVLIAATTLDSLGLIDQTGEVSEQIVGQVRSIVGDDPANQLTAMIEGAKRPDGKSLGTYFSLAFLVFAATAIFAQIQASLNRIWGVTPDPNRGGIVMFLQKRLLSFGLVLVVAFLMLVSLILSILLQSLGDWVNYMMGFQLDSWIPVLVQTGLNYFVITLLFALMLKYLPDARLRWRDVAVGAMLTSVLFGIGRYLIGLYFSATSIADGFGAARSFVLLVMWVYYSSLIFLFGAEFTQIYMRYRGRPIVPMRGAIAIIKKPQPVAYHPPEVDDDN